MPATAEPTIEARRAERDPDRLYIRTTTGDVQAWQPDEDVAVSVSFQTAARDGVGHASYSRFLTVADARSLAAALLAAADHVDALGTGRP